MRAQTARAIVEVNEAIAGATDLQILTDELHAVLNRHVNFDWLAVYSIYRHDTRINVTTNSRLCFDWDEHYSSIAAIDPANRRALASPAGTCLAFQAIYDPKDERDSYLLEFIRRKADTGMGLVLSLAPTQADHQLALCLNRQQAKDRFDSNAAEIMRTVQPLITASYHNLLTRTNAAHSAGLGPDDLRTPYVLLNERWAIIDFPQRSLNLLRSVYRNEHLGCLPAEISHWLKLIQSIKPQPQVKNCYVKVMAERRLDLRFKRIQLADGHSYGLLHLIDKRTADDFAPLTACGLSLREVALLNYLPAGYTNAQIALALGVKEITVKKHLKAIGDKLGAAGKTEILYTAMARLLDLLQEPEPGLKSP